MQAHPPVISQRFVVAATAAAVLFIAVPSFFMLGATLGIATVMLTVVVVPAACYGLAFAASAAGEYVHARPRLAQRLAQVFYVVLAGFAVWYLLTSSETAPVVFRTVLTAVIGYGLEFIDRAISVATTVRGLLGIIVILLFVIATQLIKFTARRGPP